MTITKKVLLLKKRKIYFHRKYLGPQARSKKYPSLYKFTHFYNFFNELFCIFKTKAFL